MKDSIHEIIVGMMNDPKYSGVLTFQLQTTPVKSMSVDGDDKRSLIEGLRLGNNIDIETENFGKNNNDFLLNYYCIQNTNVIPAYLKEQVSLGNHFTVISNLSTSNSVRVVIGEPNREPLSFDIPKTLFCEPFVRRTIPKLEKISLLLHPSVFIESEKTRGNNCIVSGEKLSLVASISGDDNCAKFLKELSDLGRSVAIWGAKSAENSDSRKVRGLENLILNMPAEIKELTPEINTCVNYFTKFGKYLGSVSLESEVQDFGIAETAVLDLIRISTNTSDRNDKKPFSLNSLPNNVTPKDIQEMQICTSLHLEREGLLSDANDKVMLRVDGVHAQYLAYFIDQHYRENNNTKTFKEALSLYCDEVLSRVNSHREYLQDFSFQFASDVIKVANSMDLTINRIPVTGGTPIPKFERFVVENDMVRLYLATDPQRSNALVVNIPLEQVNDFLNKVSSSLEKYYDAKGLDNTVVSFVGKTIGAFPDGHKIYDPETLINSFMFLSEKQAPGVLFNNFSRNYPLASRFQEIDPRIIQDVHNMVSDYGRNLFNPINNIENAKPVNENSIPDFGGRI